MADTLGASPVVVDNGSGVIKSGLAGSDLPESVLHNFVGRPKHERVMTGAIDEDILIGKRAEEMRGVLRLAHPMCNGVVQDWEDMERVWSHLYMKELQVMPGDHPILITESPLNPKRNRERMAEILFDRFNVPALFVSNQAVLCLYGSGRTTGIVLDCGDGVSSSVPIFEGFSLSHAISRMDYGGRDVTSYLRLLLRRSGYNFDTSAGMEVVRKIKEGVCEVSQQAYGDVRSSITKPFVLPDGSILDAGAERFQAPEVLFDPSLVGFESPGLHQALHSSIHKCDLDVRKTLLRQIVIAGGSTLFSGFGERLLSEMRRLAGSGTKIRIAAPPERKYSAWIGGSILASLASFKSMWVSAEEWNEHGANILHKRMM